MSPLARLLAGALLLGAFLLGALSTTAAPAATAPADGYLRAEPAGLTYEQWKTGRFVLGVIGLSLMAFFGFRAICAWWARRRTADGA